MAKRFIYFRSRNKRRIIVWLRRTLGMLAGMLGIGAISQYLGGTLASAAPPPPSPPPPPPLPGDHLTRRVVRVETDWLPPARQEPPVVRHSDGRIEHPTVSYETTDVRYRLVLAVIGLAVCLGAVQFFIIREYFWSRATAQASRKESSFPTAPKPDLSLPAEPRLEQLDRTSVTGTSSAFRGEAAKIKVLNGYGPSDESGFVHIPIDDAMRLVLKELPVRNEKNQSSQNSEGLLGYGDSNSGRILRGAH
jgi:hypothetical protein